MLSDAFLKSLDESELRRQMTRLMTVGGRMDVEQAPYVFQAQDYPVATTGTPDGVPNSAAVEGGKVFGQLIQAEMLSWINTDGKTEDDWITVPVNLSPADAKLIFWLYNQFQVWSEGRLDETPHGRVNTLDSEMRSRVLRNFLRAMVVDNALMHMHHLKAGLHGLTWETRQQQAPPPSPPKKKRGFFG